MTGGVHFDRRRSFLIRSLQNGVQHIGAPAGGYFHLLGFLSFRLIPTQIEERSFRTKPRLNLSRRGCSELKVGCCDVRKFSHDHKRALDTP
jgi:hypothetical protein